MFNELELFYQEHGHTEVPKRNGTLGRWVGTQRSKKSQLSKEKIELLNGINFIWQTKEERNNILWESRFQELKSYLLQNNQVHPRIDDGTELSNWIGHQRTNYNNKKLSHERIDRLNKINFIWDPKEEQWQASFKELQAFVFKNNHLKVSQDNYSLMRWISTQRSTYRKGKLSTDRVSLLNSINGWFWEK